MLPIHLPSTRWVKKTAAKGSTGCHLGVWGAGRTMLLQWEHQSASKILLGLTDIPEYEQQKKQQRKRLSVSLNKAIADTPRCTRT